QLCAGYTPDKVAGITGVPAARLEAAAKALCEASRPLVIAGSMLGSGGQAGPVMAAIALNMLLGSIGQEGGIVELPYPAPVVKGAASYREVIAKQFIDYTQAVMSGKKEAPGLLIIHAANPAYALPAGSGIKETLQKAGFVVSVASFMSETCAESDLVLPAALGMEAFDDVLTPYGSGRVTYAIARPVAKPFAQARPAGELFIALAQELGAALGVKDMPGLLFRRAYALGVNFKSMLEEGRAHVAGTLPTSASPLFYNWEAMQRAASAATADGDYMLAPVVVLGLGTPQTSVPPFAAKTVTDYQISGKYSV
ncbi:MAG: molybdopterin-dependent oxidoreductase, partial [Desulfovibrio sp.]